MRQEEIVKHNTNNEQSQSNQSDMSLNETFCDEERFFKSVRDLTIFTAQEKKTLYSNRSKIQRFCFKTLKSNGFKKEASNVWSRCSSPNMYQCVLIRNLGNTFETSLAYNFRIDEELYRSLIFESNENKRLAPHQSQLIELNNAQLLTYVLRHCYRENIPHRAIPLDEITKEWSLYFSTVAQAFFDKYRSMDDVYNEYQITGNVKLWGGDLYYQYHTGYYHLLNHRYSLALECYILFLSEYRNSHMSERKDPLVSNVSYSSALIDLCESIIDALKKKLNR